MTIILYFIIERLRKILPLEDFRLIEHIARNVGKCSICENISPRHMISVNISPSLYRRENYYYWDQDVCHLEQAVNLSQKVCDSCETIFQSSPDERYFSQMDFKKTLRLRLKR